MPPRKQTTKSTKKSKVKTEGDEEEENEKSTKPTPQLLDLSDTLTPEGLLGKFHDGAKRHLITLQWYGLPIVNSLQTAPVAPVKPAASSSAASSSSANANIVSILQQQQLLTPNIEVLVSSRKLKGQEESPSDMLFRTHQYEFRLVPNKAFIDWTGGRRSGYHVELQLFTKVEKKMTKSKKTTEEDASVIVEGDEKFHEYTLCGVPVITYTFLEDVFSGSWILNLNWPDEKNRISFRGDYCFRLQVFRKVDEMTYRKVWSRISSQFKIFSKPGVYLSKKKKEQQQTASAAPLPPPPAVPPQIHLVLPSHMQMSSSNDLIDLITPSTFNQILLAPTPQPIAASSTSTITPFDQPLMAHMQKQQLQQLQAQLPPPQPTHITVNQESPLPNQSSDFFNLLSEEEKKKYLLQQSATQAKASSIMSPIPAATPGGLNLGTPKGLLSLSFSQFLSQPNSQNGLLSSQDGGGSGSQTWDGLFAAHAAQALLQDDEEDGDVYNRMFKK